MQTNKIVLIRKALFLWKPLYFKSPFYLSNVQDHGLWWSLQCREENLSDFSLKEDYGILVFYSTLMYIIVSVFKNYQLTFIYICPFYLKNHTSIFNFKRQK